MLLHSLFECYRMLNVESFLWINPLLKLVSKSLDGEGLWEKKQQELMMLILKSRWIESCFRQLFQYREGIVDGALGKGV